MALLSGRFLFDRSYAFRFKWRRGNGSICDSAGFDIDLMLYEPFVDFFEQLLIHAFVCQLGAETAQYAVAWCFGIQAQANKTAKGNIVIEPAFHFIVT